jgi:hypothetical protein
MWRDPSIAVWQPEDKPPAVREDRFHPFFSKELQVHASRVQVMQQKNCIGIPNE